MPDWLLLKSQAEARLDGQPEVRPRPKKGYAQTKFGGRGQQKMRQAKEEAEKKAKAK